MFSKKQTQEQTVSMYFNLRKTATNLSCR